MSFCFKDYVRAVICIYIVPLKFFNLYEAWRVRNCLFCLGIHTQICMRPKFMSMIFLVTLVVLKEEGCEKLSWQILPLGERRCTLRPMSWPEMLHGLVRVDLTIKWNVLPVTKVSLYSLPPPPSLSATNAAFGHNSRSVFLKYCVGLFPLPLSF